MSDQQQPPQYPQNPQNGYAPNGYQQPQQPQPQQPQAYPPGWQPQQQMAPQYGGYAPQFTPRHKLPGGALAAAIIWIIYGALQLIGVVANLGMAGKPGPGIIIGLGIGVAFLIAGIQTSTGKAKGLLANGICSIVLGALIAIAFLALGSLVRGLGGAAGILAIVGLLFGGMLITAGILACVTNRKYKEYHHTKFGGYPT